MPTYEIPTELRDVAERTVEQARKAFEGFVTVAQKAAGAIGGTAEQAQTEIKTMNAQVFGYAEQNVNATFDFVHKLVQAKDTQEAITIQSDYLKAQIDALQAQAKELAALVQKNAPGLKK
jgi:phasin